MIFPISRQAVTKDLTIPMVWLLIENKRFEWRSAIDNSINLMQCCDEKSLFETEDGERYEFVKSSFYNLHTNPKTSTVYVRKLEGSYGFILFRLL